jgi:mannosyltransferase OCH1-like enzyme
MAFEAWDSASGADMTQDKNIPRTIHYCWYGNSPLSELGERCMETWREAMPDFLIEKWDESRLDRGIRYVDLAYRARKFAFVADYVRLLTLHEYGGLYFDTDIEVIKTFDELLDCPLFFGLQAPGSIGVGVIGAVKGNPFLRLILDKLDEEARRGALTYEPLPELVTTLARANGSVAPRLFPEEYFYPYNPYSPVALRRKPLQSNMSERTFCIHHWEGTWLGEASLGMMIAIRCRAAIRKANPARWWGLPVAQAGVSRP